MELVGSARFESYLERLISSPKGSDEFRALAEQLTVNETFFFRNADNFRAFAEIVLPERIRANTREKRLRILSAGCASGEEPYSLAVLVREALSDLGNWDVKIGQPRRTPSAATFGQTVRISCSLPQSRRW